MSKKIIYIIYSIIIRYIAGTSKVDQHILLHSVKIIVYITNSNILYTLLYCMIYQLIL